MMNGLIPIFIFVSGVSFGFIIGVNSSRDVATDETLVCSCEQNASSRVVPGDKVSSACSIRDPGGICHSMTPTDW